MAPTDPTLPVTFGFDFGGGLDDATSGPGLPGSPRAPGGKDRVPYAGLGDNLGATLVRGAMVEPHTRSGAALRTAGTVQLGKRGPANDWPTHRGGAGHLDPTVAPPSSSSSALAGFKDGPEPCGLFLALLLDDQSAVAEEDLAFVKDHRWFFKGAEGLAARGKSDFYFIWCLLELQRNVQVDELQVPLVDKLLPPKVKYPSSAGPEDGLDSKLQCACKSFVVARCVAGRMGDMYQLLTHFISNSVVFVEWERFLKGTFSDSRATQEQFLVPQLEQVWGRFDRLRTVLENMFDVLDSRYTWRHRLPAVGDLLIEHLRRRCFSSEAVTRNELLTSEKGSADTLKKVKFAFKFV